VERAAEWGNLKATSKQCLRSLSRFIETTSPSWLTAPDFDRNSIHSASPASFSFRLSGEFDPSTSNVDATAMASAYECTTGPELGPGAADDAGHAALNFARSEEKVGVTDPNELDRGLRSMGGESGAEEGCWEAEETAADDMVRNKTEVCGFLSCGCFLVCNNIMYSGYFVRFWLSILHGNANGDVPHF
jgi:hypothetical protein